MQALELECKGVWRCRHAIETHTYRGLKVDMAVMGPLCPAIDKAGGGIKKAHRGARRMRQHARRRGMA
jgi:hypothetical protein